MLTVFLALGTAFGLGMLLWLCYGWFLFPVDCPVDITLDAEGAGCHAEHCLRGLCWLISSGLLHGSILVQDTGLSSEGRTRLLCFIQSHPGVRLTPPPGTFSDITDTKDGEPPCPQAQTIQLNNWRASSPP